MRGLQAAVKDMVAAAIGDWEQRRKPRPRANIPIGMKQAKARTAVIPSGIARAVARQNRSRSLPAIPLDSARLPLCSAPDCENAPPCTARQLKDRKPSRAARMVGAKER